MAILFRASGSMKHVVIVASAKMISCPCGETSRISSVILAERDAVVEVARAEIGGEADAPRVFAEEAERVELEEAHVDAEREVLARERFGVARGLEVGVPLTEDAIDDAEAELRPLEAFVVPGGTRKAAALHVARTVCRRAERSTITLAETVAVPPVVIVYLNRLSDLLFVLARLTNSRLGAAEITW